MKNEGRIRREARARIPFWMVTTLVSLFMFANLAVAQNATGTIAGYVTDISGGTVAQAKVTATNILTNQNVLQTADSTGHYECLDLAPGEYSISADVNGYKQFKQNGITVHAGSRNRVDIALVVGSTSEQITVDSQATQVNTESAEVGTTITSKQIEDLPLNGRDAGSLITLVPGANGYGNVSWWGFKTTFVVSGGSFFQNRQTDWLLDGGLFTWTYVSSGAQLPNPDALEEFHYSMSQRSAEYGRSANATINSVLRSGTNSFHGRAWEFYRSAGLNARPFLSSSANPKLVQHQYGGTFGGPIIHDKAFFFGSYEGFRQSGASFTYAVPVPTAAERQGDFSSSSVKPINPITGTRYPDDKVAVDPVSAKILAWTPTPNTGANLWSGNSPDVQSSDQYLAKIDHNLTHAHHLSGSIFYLKNSGTSNQGSSIYVPKITDYLTDGHEEQINTADNWTISPNKLNTARFVYLSIGSNRGWLNTNESLQTLGSKFTSGTDPHPPDLTVTGYFDLDNTNDGFLYTHNQQYIDTFRWSLGRHQLSFGGQLINYHDYSFSSPGPFTKFFGAYTGNALADLVVGVASQFQYAYPDRVSGDQSHNLAALFFQDDWKLTRRLSVNLGVRWERLSRIENVAHSSPVFRPSQQSTILPSYISGYLFRDPFTNTADQGWSDGAGVNMPQRFDPRFGFSYDVAGNGRTSLRGGFGIYSGEVGSISFQPGAGPFPVPSPSCSPGTLSLVSISNPYASSCDPIIAGASWNGPPEGYTAPTPFYGGGVAPNTSRPYTMDFSFGIQQQLDKDTFFEATYVGDLGRKSWFNYDYFGGARYVPGATENNIASRYPYLPGKVAQIVVVGTPDNSSYHGLLVQVNRHMSHGVQLTASYTWSKALDANHWPVEDWSLQRSRYGISDGNYPHSFAASFIYQPTWSIENAILRRVVNGWELAGVLHLQSGNPFTIRTGTDNLVNGYYGSRPVQIGNPHLSSHRSHPEEMKAWFNTVAFDDPGIGSHGNIGVDTLQAPAMKDLDASLLRTFKLYEELKLQFHFDSFNTFNWVNLSGPHTSMNDPQFGQITGAGSMRQLQFGAKLIF